MVLVSLQYSIAPEVKVYLDKEWSKDLGTKDGPSVPLTPNILWKRSQKVTLAFFFTK